MKVFNFFAHVFTIFAFLTLGSLFMIFGIHLLSMDDAILRIQEIYASPWKSIQAIMMGFLFITIGLTFAKNLVKRSKVDAIILQSELGPIVISSQAIEDVTRKVLKRFHLIKETKIHAEIHHKDIEVRIKLILWSGGKVQELITEIQEEARTRLLKLVGKNTPIEITCDIQKIEDHETDHAQIEDPVSIQPAKQVSL